MKSDWDHPRLTEDEFRERKRQVLADEATQPEGWWWLSFVDPDAPEGERSLGAAIVRGRGIISATDEARQRGCNPGGEVLGIPLGDVTFHPSWTNTLLGREQAENMTPEDALRPRPAE